MSGIKLNQVIPEAPDSITLSMAPRAYQLEDFQYLDQQKRSSNFSEVGTGKTLVSQLWIMARLCRGMGVIVVMPPPLLIQYARSFSVFEGHPFTIDLVHKDRGKRHNIMDDWDADGSHPDVLLLSYQMFVKYHKYLKGIRKYQALVADEAHAISNAATKSFQAVFITVFNRNMDLHTMTATPCITELRSAYGFIKLNNPSAYKDLAHFDRVHTVYQTMEDSQIKQIVEYREVPLIEHNLNRNAVRRRAVDVLSLTAPTVIEHHVALDSQHYALYQQLLLERMLELGDELMIAKNQQALRQMALQIITNVGEYTTDAIADEPLENLKEIISHIEGKVIVFCHFKATVRKLNQAFRTLNPALVYGDSDVQKNVDKFLQDDSCRIAILNYQSGGAGINLQPVCNHVVFYEATGSPGQLEQALGRVHRQGQTKPVVAWVFTYIRTKSSKLFTKAYNRFEDIKIVMNDDVVFIDHLKRDLGL